ncbi:hypothetical protein FQR65_LT10252 [Abscondita terminalis]|nr:hypothetical protein FQR65_LT10252 [Abscondita terminalis]
MAMEAKVILFVENLPGRNQEPIQALQNNFEEAMTSNSLDYEHGERLCNAPSQLERAKSSYMQIILHLNFTWNINHIKNSYNAESFQQPYYQEHLQIETSTLHLLSSSDYSRPPARDSDKSLQSSYAPVFAMSLNQNSQYSRQPDTQGVFPSKYDTRLPN